jgi:hypothetical protein
LAALVVVLGRLETVDFANDCDCELGDGGVASEEALNDDTETDTTDSDQLRPEPRLDRSYASVSNKPESSWIHLH